MSHTGLAENNELGAIGDERVEVNPIDSISNVGGSDISTTSSAHAKAAARKAALEAKSRRLEEMQQLELSQLEADLAYQRDRRLMEMQCQQLKLKTDVEAATAEEATLAAFVGSGRSISLLASKLKPPPLLRGSTGVQVEARSQHKPQALAAGLSSGQVTFSSVEEMSEQTFCLKWDGFSSRLGSVFDELRCDEELVDVTLCCVGGMVGAHRLVLSACSPYFRHVFKSCKYPHVALVLMDVAVAEVRALVEFMYCGRVDIQQSRLSSFIRTASLLQISGLNGDAEQNLPSPVGKLTATDAAAPSVQLTSGADSAPPAAAVSSRQCLSNFPSHESPPLVLTVPAVGAVHQQTPVPVKLEKREEMAVEEGYDCSAGSPLTGGMLDSFMSTDGGDHRSVHVPLPQELCYSALDSRLGAGRNGSVQRRLLIDSRENTKFSKYAVCSVCSKQYSSRSALAHHMKLHQGQTECSLCGRVYASVPTLREHLKVVHKLSEHEVQDIAPKRRYDLPQNPRVVISVNDLLNM